jgi:hypothetical protein
MKSQQKLQHFSWWSTLYLISSDKKLGLVFAFCTVPIICQNVEHLQLGYSVVHSLRNEGECSVRGIVGNVCLYTAQLRTNVLNFLHFVDHWRCKSYENFSNSIMRWQMWYAGGCRCSPQFFFGGFRLLCCITGIGLVIVSRNRGSVHYSLLIWICKLRW